MKRRLFFCFVILGALATFPSAQMRVVPLDEEQGHVALGLALRHLANTGIFMHTTAHPDDENNGLLVMLNRGQGYRTAPSPQRRAAMAARTKSVRRFSKRSACCAPASWRRCIASTAPSSTSPA